MYRVSHSWHRQVGCEPTRISQQPAVSKLCQLCFSHWVCGPGRWELQCSNLMSVLKQCVASGPRTTVTTSLSPFLALSCTKLACVWEGPSSFSAVVQFVLMAVLWLIPWVKGLHCITWRVLINLAAVIRCAADECVSCMTLNSGAELEKHSMPNTEMVGCSHCTKVKKCAAEHHQSAPTAASTHSGNQFEEHNNTRRLLYTYTTHQHRVCLTQGCSSRSSNTRLTPHPPHLTGRSSSCWVLTR